MERKGWYLVAYDIACPKRLVKVHRIMKKTGLAVQRSVFLVAGTKTDIKGLLNQLTKKIKLNEDDLRAYPIMNPENVWTNGPNPIADLPVMYFGQNSDDIKGAKYCRRKSNIFSLLKKLMKGRNL